MRFGERLTIFFGRPIYRTFLERPLWWFLARIKAFFFAEVNAQLESIERRLQALEIIERRLEALQQSTAQANAARAGEWDAVEQLLLAVLRQPEERNHNGKATRLTADG